MITGMEALGNALVDVYLQHPQSFYAAEVLGPACMKMSKFQGSAGSITGKHDPASIKQGPAFIMLPVSCPQLLSILTS